MRGQSHPGLCASVSEPAYLIIPAPSVRKADHPIHASKASRGDRRHVASVTGRSASLKKRPSAVPPGPPGAHVPGMRNGCAPSTETVTGRTRKEPVSGQSAWKKDTRRRPPATSSGRPPAPARQTLKRIGQRRERSHHVSTGRMSRPDERAPTPDEASTPLQRPAASAEDDPAPPVGCGQVGWPVGIRRVEGAYARLARQTGPLVCPTHLTHTSGGLLRSRAAVRPAGDRAQGYGGARPPRSRIPAADASRVPAPRGRSAA